MYHLFSVDYRHLKHLGSFNTIEDTNEALLQNKDVDESEVVLLETKNDDAIRVSFLKWGQWVSDDYKILTNRNIEQPR